MAKILIVDDSEHLVVLLSEIFFQHGFEVESALSKKEMVYKLLASAPDLILLDILMPQIDGYKVCSQLKASPRAKDIPIIFISVLDEVFDKVKAFAVGGVDYITQPFQAEEVLARIEQQLRIQRLSNQLKEEIIRFESHLPAELRSK